MHAVEATHTHPILDCLSPQPQPQQLPMLRHAVLPFHQVGDRQIDWAVWRLFMAP
jgi:hypothetical protein